MQEQIQKIQKGVAGTFNSSILDTFLFFWVRIIEKYTKFQRKRGGCGPLGPRLNPPMEYIWHEFVHLEF